MGQEAKLSTGGMSEDGRHGQVADRLAGCGLDDSKTATHCQLGSSMGQWACARLRKQETAVAGEERAGEVESLVKWKNIRCGSDEGKKGDQRQKWNCGRKMRGVQGRGGGMAGEERQKG